MKNKFNGYYWTLLDLIIVMAVFSFLIFMAYKVFRENGISLASVAGTIWAMGILGVFFWYQLPIFGHSFAVQKILDQKNEYLSFEEVEIVMGNKRHSKIPKKFLGAYVIFFCVSGGLTLLGVITNT